MREFKFRAWHKVERCMLGMSGADHYGQEYQGKVFSWKNEGQPITIMQYTGMKDCEGVEIYEGDILDDGSGYLYVVSFIDGGFVAHEKNDVLMFTNLDDYDFEVLGNIYETPELLE